MSFSSSFDAALAFTAFFGEFLGLASPFAFRFAGTRDVVVLGVGFGAGAREECRELSDRASALAIACREGFRGFVATGVGVGARGGAGSASERILEKAMGSAGLLGV